MAKNYTFEGTSVAIRRGQYLNKAISRLWKTSKKKCPICFESYWNNKSQKCKICNKVLEQSAHYVEKSNPEMANKLFLLEFERKKFESQRMQLQRQQQELERKQMEIQHMKEKEEAYQLELVKRKKENQRAFREKEKQRIERQKVLAEEKREREMLRKQQAEIATTTEKVLPKVKLSKTALKAIERLSAPRESGRVKSQPKVAKPSIELPGLPFASKKNKRALIKNARAKPTLKKKPSKTPLKPVPQSNNTYSYEPPADLIPLEMAVEPNSWFSQMQNELGIDANHEPETQMDANDMVRLSNEESQIPETESKPTSKYTASYLSKIIEKYQTASTTTQESSVDEICQRYQNL